MSGHHTANVQVSVTVQQSSVTVDKTKVQEIVGECNDIFELPDGTKIVLNWPCVIYYF